MISMNGFTLGFFIPKQELEPKAVRTTKSGDDRDAQPARRETTGPSLDEDDQEPSPLFHYAYRFF
ncbi:hypothetical protein [Rhizobium sp. TRM95796]|uniref:hypothetical protein n=1 Tax=Rhizobium sp. TRM95796 TaxID=2979862 RepID=UPI0021E769DD|nr:hypothetical protein [Rhizobium sp. TRM95796]MCV3767070.1 hypothetical protein [Rhizobium sp. TRM95796]